MDWKTELSRFLRSPEDLVRAGILDTAQAARITFVGNRYITAISPYYASLIEKGNPQCPIYLQAVPDLEEDQITAGFVADPLEDIEHQKAPRLTQRLVGRALLHVTSSCSTYCRFCFRKSLLNELKTDLFIGDYAQAFSYLGQHPEIHEIILTGGDPFMVSDEALAGLVGALSQIESLRTLRIHTRVPVTFPVRITQQLVSALDSRFSRRVVVCHFNHPKELTAEARRACDQLKHAGIQVWNQAVLLKGVNADPGVLSKLFRALFSWGIRNYYLHHPDRSAGTAHFYLSRKEGLRIFEKLRLKLNADEVPEYVVDLLGSFGKVPVDSTLGSEPLSV